jgi:cytoskeletal protein RodZ
VSVGEILAQARSQAGLTIAQVSQKTCIRETIIRGIEHDDFSACGGDFYARGHIRSIARAVGADPDEVIRAYDAAHSTRPPITAREIFEPATPIRLKERRAPNWTVAMIVVLALALGYGIYRAVAPGSPVHQVAAGTRPSASRHSSTATPPASTPPPAAPKPPRHRIVIRLTAIQACWVEFTKPDGTYLSQYYIPAGSKMHWAFRHPVDMRIGNPGGIELTVSGKNLGHPGSVGQPVTLSFGPGGRIRTQTSGTG